MIEDDPAEKLDLAKELYQCHDDIEGITAGNGTIRPKVVHGQSVHPDKEDFPDAIERAINGVLEDYPAWMWASHVSERGAEYRSITLAQSARGGVWSPVIEWRCP